MKIEDFAVPERDRKALGARLAEARKSARLTQEEAAEFLNVSKMLISQWEHGLRNVPPERMPLLAKLYGDVDLVWLILGPVPPREPEGLA